MLFPQIPTSLSFGIITLLFCGYQCSFVVGFRVFSSIDDIDVELNIPMKFLDVSVCQNH